jgi:multidrug resistance protein MdtO
MSATTNDSAASRFGYLVVITIPLWDRHIPAELRVENTLWAAGAITIGSVITVFVELVYAGLMRGDDLVRSLAERLATIEELLDCYAASRAVDRDLAEHMTRLATRGTSRLRRYLRQSSYTPRYREQMGAVVALVGRLVDIAANLTAPSVDVPDDARERLRTLAENIGRLRSDLLAGRTPGPMAFEGNTPPALPLFGEMEETVALIAQVFEGAESLSSYAPPSPDEPPSRFLVPDALTNPDHIKFGLRGCMAASLCYITYTALNWPEISTAVTTCLVTALTTIGASRQKQLLRFGGALVGGVVVGIGAQIFILPSLDSIGGFTVLFLAVMIPAAWIETSSPRLSYFGAQVAVAFDLINLQEFKMQTSLALARDRVLGIMLGLIMMWLAFDQLWSAPAAVEMRRAFISNLRNLAQLLREPLPGSEETWRSVSLRETISASFDKVRTLADGVLLEFGPSRQKDLTLRDRIRRWQPQLRLIFLTRIALLKYRLQLPGFELPEPARLAQQKFDNELAAALEAMGNRMEGKVSEGGEDLEDSLKRLERTAQASCPELPREAPAAQLQTFLALSRRIEGLTGALDREI